MTIEEARKLEGLDTDLQAKAVGLPGAMTTSARIAGTGLLFAGVLVRPGVPDCRPLSSLQASEGRPRRVEWPVGRVSVENRGGNKDGDLISVGGGVAYTPDEDFQTGRLFSYQVGSSYEYLARDRVNGHPGSDTGGSVLFLHPTFVYSPGHDLLLFGMVSVPVRRDFKDPAAQDGYRFGTGVLYAW